MTTAAAPIDIAHARLQREQRLLEDAEDELARAEAALAAVEPPTGKAFDIAIRQREEAHSRRDAIHERLRFAERAAEAEKERAAAEERAALRVQLEGKVAALADGDAAIVKEVLQFMSELTEACRLQRELLDHIVALEFRLGQEPDRSRSYWARYGDGQGNALQGAWLCPEAQQAAWRVRLEGRTANGT